MVKNGRFAGFALTPVFTNVSLASVCDLAHRQKRAINRSSNKNETVVCLLLFPAANRKPVFHFGITSGVFSYTEINTPTSQVLRPGD
jgi:hypothetical protein